MSQKIRMIVCDLDGTLFQDDKTVSERTQDALRRCGELGIKVIFATGRGSRAKYQVPFELFDGHVINNGAAAFVGEERIYFRLMSAEAVRPLLMTCDKLGLKAAALLDGKHYSNFDVEKEWPGSMMKFEVVEFYLHELDSEKLYAVTRDNDDLAVIKASLHEDLYLTTTRDGFVMIMHKEATKSKATIVLAEHWGIAQSEIVAFGDDMNDLDLLSYAGIGVAMGDAVEEAKAAADQVCEGNNEDGIAKWIEENIF